MITFYGLHNVDIQSSSLRRILMILLQFLVCLVHCGIPSSTVVEVVQHVQVVGRSLGRGPPQGELAAVGQRLQTR